MIPSVLLPLFLACAGGGDPLDSGTPTNTGDGGGLTTPTEPTEPTGPTEPTEPTGPTEPTEPETPVVEVEEVPGAEVDDDWIFSLDTIHEMELTVPADSVSALLSSPYEYARASMSLDGVTLPDIGIRLRGKIGSYRSLTGKPKIKLDFNQFVDGQRFYGLEGLALNNSVVDCSYLKEVMGYQVFERAGVPRSRTGWARLTINGGDYGLYQLIEVPDDRFLKRNYVEPDGNLYDGKYLWYGGYSYTLLDFGIGVDTLFPLEEGEDVAWADIAAVSSRHLALRGRSGWYEAMGTLLDWEAIHRMWAAEQWVGHVDGYCMNRNNYRVYFDPADEKGEMIPWDLDYAFLHDWQWGMNWASPTGQLAGYCLYDSACRADWQAAMGDLIDAIDPEELLTLLAEQASLIQEEATSDPRRECSAGDIAPSQALLRNWIQQRNDSLRTWWGL